MDAGVRYRIRTPQVACQSLQGESVLINFENGCYYSSEGTGSIIITWLERGISIGEIVGRLATGSEDAEGELERTVRAFIAELERDRLITPVSDPAAGDAGECSPAANGSAGPPVLRKFTDLQDLLLLDPIHEVGDAGWPWPPGMPPATGQ